MQRRLLILAGGLGVALTAWALALTFTLPAATGPYAVGRRTIGWVDAARPEVMTAAPQDVREVIADIWYPAEPGAEGARSAYFPGLDVVAADLVASGEVSAPEVAGLRLLRSEALPGAAVAAAAHRYPVLLLSPGNATNVEFYAALAADLASQGYVVVGLNHPYDVAAVALSTGGVARYSEADRPADWLARQAMTAGRIAVRVADVQFALDQLAALNADPSDPLGGRLDLSRVGILGHSLGGLTAAQACLADVRLRACLNLDGLQAGGPFAVEANPTLPTQPFMLITKEATLPPAVTAWMAALPGGGYSVTVPGATHASFTDTPLLSAVLLPMPTPATAILAQVRGYTRAFFDHTLLGQPSALLAATDGAGGVRVTVYSGG